MNWDWFVTEGIWLLVTLAVAALAYWALRTLVPRWIKAMMSRMTALGTEEELQRASRTVSLVLVWLGTIVIITGVVLGILPRFGVDISSVTGAISDWMLSHGIRILIIVALAIAIHQIAKRLLPIVIEGVVARRGEKRPVEEVKKRTETLSSFLVGAVVVVIWMIAAFMMLSEIGVNITPLIAGAGIVALAIAFGAQSLIRDILAGFFVITENQYAKGDWVKIADVVGEVEDINLRRTILRDLDGIVHVIPNGEVRTASNLTKEWGGVNLNISVAYGEDLDHAIEVINRVSKEMTEEEYWCSLILQTPEVLRVDGLGTSGIEIKLWGKTKALYNWQVTGELRKRIKKAFDQEGIEIPWPHIKLYFGEPSKQGPEGKEG